MAPKAASEKKQQIASDKTFGMKNKNKSKVVQKYIKAINANVTGKTNREDQAERQAEKVKKEQTKSDTLNNALFNLATDKKGRAFDPIAKAKAKVAEEESIAAGKKIKEAIRKEIIEGLANSIRLTNVKGVRMSELGGHPIISALKEKHPDTFKIISLLLFIKANDKVFWVDDDESSNPMVRVLEDVTSEVEPDERPIEDIIEEKRAALPPGGTPVTLASFTLWKEARAALHLASVAEAIANDKKKGGKGAAIMSGRDLFHFNPDLFTDADEEGACDAAVYDEVDSDAGLSAIDENAAKAEQDLGEDDGDADEDAEDASGARGSGDADEPAGDREVPINKDLFLEGDDLPDDLDDLDDD